MAQEKLDDLAKGKQNRNIYATGFHDATAIKRECATRHGWTDQWSRRENNPEATHTFSVT